MTIREVSVADAGELLEIYRGYVEHTLITFEYEVPALEEFEERIRNTLKRYPYLAAVDEKGEITGYAYASAFKGRKAYEWSVETSVYIKEGRHGEGIGKQLYSRLEEVLIQQKVCNMCACITHPNPESEAFHEKLGYTTAAHFHHSGYKLGKWADVVWMEKSIRRHDKMPEAFIPYPELSGIEK